MKKELVLTVGFLVCTFTIVFSQSLHDADETQRISLSKAINTAYLEARPLISHDGQTLFFCRRYFPENLHGEKDKQDIWLSTLLENGEWSRPENLNEPINNKKINAIISISPDGKEVLLVNSYEKLGKQSTKVLARSTLTETGWEEPESVTIHNYSNKGLFADFYFSFKSKVLVLAIQKKDDKNLQGNQDLYVSHMDDAGNFGEPINLGGTINTSRAEYAPFLGADGKSLFFVSEGHDGLGGGDIFYSERLDDSWQKWSVPENLGQPINSANEETYFSITADFKEIYFESYRKKAINRNIFKAKLPEQFNPYLKKDLPVAFKNPEKMDYATQSPSAEQDFTPSSTEVENSEPADNVGMEVTSKIEDTGGKNLQLTATSSEDEETAQVEVMSTGEVESPIKSYPEEIKVEASNQQENGAMKMAKNQPPIDLNNEDLVKKLLSYFDDAIIVKKDNHFECHLTKNIYFDFNSISIKEEYKDRLNKINDFLVGEDDLVLKIEGHADAIGNQQINHQISDSRAKSIYSFISKNGAVDNDQIAIESFGETDPMATNDDNSEGRELNRRVSLKFILPQQ